MVIGGASLTGGLASPLSTFVAAIFLTGLNQMLRTMGLPTSLQFVVFGLVIIGGMFVSGDRIIRASSRCSASGNAEAVDHGPETVQRDRDERRRRA